MQPKKLRKKRKLGSYPFASVMFSVTLALLIIGLFGLLLIHTTKLTEVIQESVEIQVFLKKEVSSSERNRINRILGSKPYVVRKEELPQITFVSRDEAATQFIQDTGEDFTELLGENPLRDLFSVTITPSYQVPDSLLLISQEIGDLQGVYDVNYVESLVQSIYDNLTKIGAILLVFALILFLVVIILINNTIKLALFSQRFLIRSMQLVGATGGFIKRPFLMRSILYGALSGILSSIILWGLYMSAINKIPDLEAIRDQERLIMLYASMVIIGIFVAYLSTYSAVRRYLKTSLDELY